MDKSWHPGEQTLQALLAGKRAEELEAVARSDVADFLRRRQRILLYE